jgi:alpha-ketoglutarate-dependent sulfate ester dioxygenase
VSIVRTRDLVVTPLTGTIGARVDGVNAGRPLPEESLAFLREALYDYRVLFLPGQDLTFDQQIAFGSTWGELLPAHQFVPGMADYPNIQDNDSARSRGAAGWHTDHTFVEEVPAVTVLLSRVVPERGGDTMWADLVSAYDALAAPLQRLVSSLIAVHDPLKQFSGFLRPDADPALRQGLLELKPVRQPLVRIDPVTSRPSLLINPECLSHIEGMDPEQSDDLIDLLTRHVLVPERTVRWHWSPGDLVVWSNPTVLHKVVHDFGSQRRVTQRVMVRGPRLIGPDGFHSEVIRNN